MQDGKISYHQYIIRKKKLQVSLLWSYIRNSDLEIRNLLSEASPANLMSSS